ncbi:unnamed protein product [Penicillium viridicatum]
MAYNKAAGSPYRLTNTPDGTDGTVIRGIDVVDGCGSCEKGKDWDENGHSMDTCTPRESTCDLFDMGLRSGGRLNA